MVCLHQESTVHIMQRHLKHLPIYQMNYTKISMIYPSPPSAAYTCQWIRSALIQMACRLFSAKPLSKPMLDYCQLHPYEQTSVKIFNQNTKCSIHQNAFENTFCEMVAFLSRGRWVKFGQTFCQKIPLPTAYTQPICFTDIKVHVSRAIIT